MKSKVRQFLMDARMFNANRGQCLAVLAFPDGSFEVYPSKMVIGG